MGGKGRKRREKNYRAAHGGYTRLPPPPDPSQVDSLPSKLRKIMSFASLDGSANVAQEKRKTGDVVEGRNKGGMKNVVEEEAKRDDSDSEIAHGNHTNEKRKKKRKRKQASDLRFVTEELGSSSKRKERKKK